MSGRPLLAAGEELTRWLCLGADPTSSPLSDLALSLARLLGGAQL